MSDVRPWYVRQEGQVIGPLNSGQLKQLAEKGTVTRTTDVRRGDGSWVAAEKVKGLFSTVDAMPPEIPASAWPNSLRLAQQSPAKEVAEESKVKTFSARATTRQKEYAHELGVTFPDDITRAEISKLIDDAITKRDDERYGRLDELSERESKAWAQMREEVLAEIDSEDCRLSKSEPLQMAQSLSDEKDLAAFIVSIPWGQIEDFNNLENANVRVSFCDEMTIDDVESVILIYAANIMRRRGIQP